MEGNVTPFCRFGNGRHRLLSRATVDHRAPAPSPLLALRASPTEVTGERCLNRRVPLRPCNNRPSFLPTTQTQQNPTCPFPARINDKSSQHLAAQGNGTVFSSWPPLNPPRNGLGFFSRQVPFTLILDVDVTGDTFTRHRPTMLTPTVTIAQGHLCPAESGCPPLKRPFLGCKRHHPSHPSPDGCLGCASELQCRCPR